MFVFYAGVTHVLVPDCLKQGVLKCHLYDPDLDPAYAALGVHFATAIVPARPGHPKDKALVENGVKLLMRYQRFRHRRTRLTSLAQVNQALEDCAKRINDRRHTRFGVTRRERFEALERISLKPLPQAEFEGGEWKEAKLHADCYVSVESDYYSAPHIHRHKKLKIKITENHVEVFLNLERLAIHPRSRHKEGRRIKIDEHFPPNSVRQRRGPGSLTTQRRAARFAESDTCTREARDAREIYPSATVCYCTKNEATPSAASPVPDEPF